MGPAGRGAGGGGGFERVEGVAEGVEGFGVVADEGGGVGVRGAAGGGEGGACFFEEHVAVYDALGRRVLRVDVDGGASSVALPLAGLSPGVYVVRLTAGGASRSVRLVVAR